jgi:hypothetical protein
MSHPCEKCGIFWGSLTLEVVDVKVERVQDITQEGAAAEGVEPYDSVYQHIDPATGDDMGCEAYLEYRAAFESLWDGIYKEKGFGWDANPWTWVVKFRKVEA